MKHSDFYRMTPAQKESYLARMMPAYRGLKKTLQSEIREYVLKVPRLHEKYARFIG